MPTMRWITEMVSVGNWDFARQLIALFGGCFFCSRALDITCLDRVQFKCYTLIVPILAVFLLA